MQPSKAKSTRYQPKALYLVSALLLCTSAVVTYSTEYDLPWINQAIALLPSHNYVHWRSREEAWQECQRTHKPILYFLLAKKDPRSIMLDGQCLADPAVAEIIDSQFIPVIHWIDRKHQMTQDTDPDCKYFQNKMGLSTGNAPCVAAVPYSLHDAKTNDLTSSANLVELDIESTAELQKEEQYYPGNNYYGGRSYYQSNGRMLRHSGGVFYGYQSKQDFLDFLYDARLWHKLPPTAGRINWLPLADLDLKSKSGKPKLLALVQDVGASSDSIRLNLFWKNKSVKLINTRFDPYLIEFHRMDPDFNSKYTSLRKKYNIKQLPALVVLNSPGKDESSAPVQHGFNNMHTSLDFLDWALKPFERGQQPNQPQDQQTESEYSSGGDED